MKNKVLLALLLISFIFPLLTFASKTQWPLKKTEVQNFFQIIREEPLTIAQQGLFSDSFLDDSLAREDGAVMLVKQAVLAKQLDYWFREFPKEFSIKFLKTTFTIIKSIYTGDISGIIGLIEKETVKKANQYASNWFVQNEIKFGAGEVSYSFKSYKDNSEIARFQYIIVYLPNSPKSGEMVAEFYSKNPIEPPTNKCPILVGPYSTKDSQFSTCWPYDRWQDENGDGKIEQFILRVRGKVIKNNRGLFAWDEKENPIVEIDFNRPVPEIDQSDILKTEKAKEPNFFWEKTKQFFNWLRGKLPGGEVLPKIGEGEEKEEIEVKDKSTKTISSRVEEIINELKQLKQKEKEMAIEKEMAKEIEPIESQKETQKESQKEEVDWEEVKKELEKMPEEEIKKVEKEVKQLKEEMIWCQKGNKTPKMDKLIFNEIAWMGTKANSADEWIELKNISREKINLTGWQILTKDKGIKLILKDAYLSPDNFFLLERTDDNSVPIVSADQIYTGALKNTNEAIYLFNQNCELEDEILANPNWPKGDNSSKRTMERKDNLNWQTSFDIGGTPKKKNSLGYIVSENESKSGGSIASPTSVSAPLAPTACPFQNLSAVTSSPAYFPIIFNEIAWMGTANSSYDEWIELKNISTSTISLNNWQIIGKIIGKKIEESEPSIKIFLLNKTIGNNSSTAYFLLEKSSSNPALEYLRDEVYTGGSLINNPNPNFELYLFDDKCNLIDFISAISSWPAGDNDSKRTMERDQDISNWHTYQGEGENGIMGTPKAENSSSSQTQVNPFSQKLANHLVISEIQMKDKEFVELYNPTNNPVSLANWYLSYFSSEKDWNNPYKNIQFSTTTIIATSSYYLVGLKDYPTSTISGYPAPDWRADTINLSNTDGALGIFSCNPKEASTSSEAMSCKIDVVGWGEVKVKEGTSSNPVVEESKSLTRKQNENKKYFDDDNNLIDFEEKFHSPTNSKNETGNLWPPTPVSNFQIASFIDNLVSLSWATTTDPDTPEENISYVIYFSKDNETSTEITTTTATTTITLSDLYYASTYHFGIRAFDGLHYSELTTTTPLIIPAETPDWPMYGNNPQHTFQSQFEGPLNFNSKEEFVIYGNSVSHPVIDQNGTIYVNSSPKIKALKKDGSLKWKYETNAYFSETLYQSPLIGPDGSIYMILHQGTGNGKLFSVSPAGKLRWELDNVKTYVSDGNPSYNINLVMANNVLYYAAPYEDNNKVYLMAIEPANGALIWKFLLTEESSSSTLPSTPTIASDGTIYVSLDKTLFAIDSNTRKLKWKRTFPLCGDCQLWCSDFRNFIRSLTVDDKEGIIYFILKGTRQSEGRCYGSLYALDLAKIDSTTSTIQNEEIKWKKDLGLIAEPLLLGNSQNLYVIQYGGSNSSFSIFNKNENPIFSTSTLPDLFESYLIDKNENIYGTYVWGGIKGIILNEAKDNIASFIDPSAGGLWYHSSPSALSKEGILYVPSSPYPSSGGCVGDNCYKFLMAFKKE